MLSASYLQPDRSSFTSCEQVVAYKNSVTNLHSLRDQANSLVSTDSLLRSITKIKTYHHVITEIK